jgi:transposase
MVTNQETMMPKQNDLPEVVEKSEEEIASIIQTIQDSNLSDNIKSFIIKCIELSIWFPRALQKKNASLRRLRALIFGVNNSKKNRRKKSTDKSSGNLSASPEDDASQSPDGNTNITENTPINNPDEQNQETTNALVLPQKSKGHGRMPHTVYENCTEITIELDYQVGDPCPTLCGGKLRYYSPGILIRIAGDNIAHVTRYTMIKLRCNLCDIIIKPTLPDNIGKDKYDASFKAMLALQKYYVAVPFHRQEHFQAMLGFSLSDATQWDLIEQLASSCYPVFNTLKTLAANGELIHNDDTKVRILEVMKRNQNSDESDKAKGMFTTGIISVYEGHKIALFLNGTKHAGNNLQDVLQNRAKEKGEIIQMCDGSSQNIVSALEISVLDCIRLDADTTF